MAAHARAWSELAETRLAQAGFRRGGARAAVIELLDDQIEGDEYVDTKLVLKARKR